MMYSHACIDTHGCKLAFGKDWRYENKLYLASYR
jgi:hypothetical protein